MDCKSLVCSSALALLVCGGGNAFGQYGEVTYVHAKVNGNQSSTYHAGDDISADAGFSFGVTTISGTPTEEDGHWFKFAIFLYDDSQQEVQEDVRTPNIFKLPGEQGGINFSSDPFDASGASDSYEVKVKLYTKPYGSGDWTVLDEDFTYFQLDS